MSADLPNAEHTNSDLATIMSVDVKGLFGTFDYTIPLDLEDRVTVMFGLNGSGKTTILRLLNSLNAIDFFYLQKIPFRSLKLELDIGTLNVTKDQHLRLVFKRSGSKRATFSIKIPSLTKLLYEIPRGIYETQTIRDIELFRAFSDIETYIYRSEGDFPRRPKEYFDELPNAEKISFIWAACKTIDKGISRKQIRRLFDLLISLPCHLLPATRLSEVPVKTIPFMRKGKKGARRRVPKLRVDACALELMNKIDDVRRAYSDTVQVLDRGFAKKVLDWKRAGRTTTDTKLDVASAAEKLEGRYRELVRAGLLEEVEETLFDPSDLEEMKTAEALRPFFAAHYDNLEKKLREFEELLEKVDLFTDVVEEFYLGKAIKADQKKGLAVVSTDDPPRKISIELSDLSSGEQHILVLAYDLIFNANPNEFVMIDEPELSLHTTWQYMIVKNLQRIGESSKLYFLLATHSPLILESAYESAVELDGFQDE